MNEQKRFVSIDLLRGLIMIIMAVDHCYLAIYKVHFNESWNIILPNYGSSGVFFTRWISNICAPGFALLMGMSMTIYCIKNTINNESIRMYFVKRGLVIILLQQLLSIPSILVKFSYLYKLHLFTGGVLYALGFSMVISSFIINLKSLNQILIGLIIFLLNYFISNALLNTSISNLILNLLVIPGENKWLIVNYPVMPWFGITCIGMGFGGLFTKDKTNFIKKSWIFGVVCLLMFLLLRLINFGDYNHIFYSSGIINYLAVIKYPPSISFLLCTFGLLFLLFWIINKFESFIIFRPLIIFGQVPLFFYFAHYYLYIILSKLTNQFIPLGIMFLFWLLGLILLLPVAYYYLEFKRSRSRNSFWRLF